MSLKWVPNLVTGVRLLLIIPIVYTLLCQNWQLAFYLFLIAGISDGLDGILARYYGWTTKLGALLDPLADKLLMMSSFVTLMWLSKIPWWLSVAAVARDLWIMLGAMAYRFFVGPLVYEPLFMSKLNTVLQLCLILFILIHLGFYKLPIVVLQSISLMVFITTTISFVQYTWIWMINTWRYFKSSKSF